MNILWCVRRSFRVKSPQKINKIKKHDVPDLYRSLHRIRFYLEICLQLCVGRIWCIQTGFSFETVCQTIHLLHKTGFKPVRNHNRFFHLFSTNWNIVSNIVSRNKRENNVRDCFSNEPLKNICLILFLTNLIKYMAVFHFLKSTSNDVTDVYFNWNHTR